MTKSILIIGGCWVLGTAIAWVFVHCANLSGSPATVVAFAGGSLGVAAGFVINEIRDRPNQ